MSKILHITSSPKGTHSITTRLGKAIIDKIKTMQQEDVIVEELDLLTDPFPHFGALQLEAFHTAAGLSTPEQAAAARRSEQAISQLLNADILVISAPMHNYGIPAALKAYFDHIARAGVTFGFSRNGPVGLFSNKKAYIAFSAGWDFSHPAMQSYDFSSPYLKAVLKMIGIHEVKEFRVEGASSPLQKEASLAKAIAVISV